MRIIRTATVAALLLALATAAPGRAQGPQAGGLVWQGVLLGAHVGVQNQSLFEGVLLGGQAHVLLDPWGKLVLMPNAEIEFRNGVRDWQANADAAVMPLRGIYVGGGFAYRNTVYEEELGRETRRGYSVFFGLRSPPVPGRLSTQIELRWSFISELRPRMLTLGVNFPVLLIRF
jgi:hypothetical protein